MDNPQDWPLIERSASSYTDDEEEKTDANVLEYENIVERNTIKGEENYNVCISNLLHRANTKSNLLPTI